MKAKRLVRLWPSLTVFGFLLASLDNAETNAHGNSSSAELTSPASIFWIMRSTSDMLQANVFFRIFGKCESESALYL